MKVLNEEADSVLVVLMRVMKCSSERRDNIFSRRASYLKNSFDSAEKVYSVFNQYENKMYMLFNDDWFWITNEPWGGYVNWFPGEPSKQDADGTLEDCLCLWNVDDNGWTMNDQRNDLPSFTSTQGRIGYICEYEAIAGYK